MAVKFYLIYRVDLDAETILVYAGMPIPTICAVR